jgi:hypothetical protein
MQQDEQDAVLLASILAEPSDTWPDRETWGRAHTLSMDYVRTQYRAARNRQRFAQKPKPPTVSETPTRTPDEAEHDFLARVNNGLDPNKDTIYALANEYGLSAVFVRSVLRGRGLRVPSTARDRKPRSRHPAVCDNEGL